MVYRRRRIIYPDAGWPWRASQHARRDQQLWLIDRLLDLTVTVGDGYGFIVEGKRIVTASALLKGPGPYLVAPLGCDPSLSPVPAKAEFGAATVDS
jgi:hypothetical protein